MFLLHRNGLIRPFKSEQMKTWRVDQRLNNVMLATVTGSCDAFFRLNRASSTAGGNCVLKTMSQNQLLKPNPRSIPRGLW